MSELAYIDWDGIRRRIEAAGAAIDQGATLSAEAEKALLKQRAKQCAAEPAAETAAQETIEVLAFALGEEQHAFELRWVHEVCPMRELTRVPCTPAYVAGIINLRGEIRTVLDLGAFFGLPPKPPGELDKIIIVQAGEVQVGVLADDILGVRTIRVAALQTSLPTLTGVRAEGLRGITPDHLAILDPGVLFSPERINVASETPG